jgi:hypothetical protein
MQRFGERIKYKVPKRIKYVYVGWGICLNDMMGWRLEYNEGESQILRNKEFTY